MPTLTQLEYIVAVHKHGHFGRAAEVCAVSQPSLSAQIRKTEEELKCQLFDRSKKPILATDMGKRIIEQAQVVLRAHKKLFDVAHMDQVSGQFHLGVIPTLSPYVVPLFVENLVNKYPQLELTISEYQTREIIERLHNDELDGALLVSPLHDDKIEERPLFCEPFYAFVSDDHPLFKRKTVKDSDLDVDSAWLLSEGHCFRDQMLNLCGGGHVKSRKDIRFASGSMETLINLVRQGDGYTLLPYLTTATLTNEEKERQLKPFTQPIPTRQISLAFSRTVLKAPILKALAKEIKASLPKGFPKPKTSRVIDL